MNFIRNPGASSPGQSAITAAAIVAAAFLAGCAKRPGVPTDTNSPGLAIHTAGPAAAAATTAAEYADDGAGPSRRPADPVAPGGLVEPDAPGAHSEPVESDARGGLVEPDAPGEPVEPGAHSEPAGLERIDREVYVMGTVLHARVAASERDAARAALEAAVAEIERADRLLSTWDAGSSLATLNAAAVGVAVTVPRALADALAEAASWADRTGRAFDPTIGALIDAWDLRGAGRRPAAAELDGALGRTGAGAFTIDALRGRVTRKVAGAWIDSGAFGKGLALRWAADTLRARGVARARLNLGGQVVVLSGPEGGAPWEVVVSHPARRGDAVAYLRLNEGSVATSGNSERGVRVGDSLLGHLLDPRTGRPVRSWGSVTVVSADPVEADVLSTALYVMGPDAGLEWAAGLEDVGVLYIVGTDRIRFLHNEAMERWLGGAGATAGPRIHSERLQR